jgi:hypothetical protein
MQSRHRQKQEEEEHCMSWLQSSVKYLRERDVVVDDAGADNIIRCGAERELTLTVFDDHQNFRLTRSNPPGQDDLPPEFSIAYSAMDDALLAIWHYYHGLPVKVDGWNISLHQRPHWPLAKLQFCVAAAQALNADTFAAHVEHLRKTTPYPYQGMTHDVDKHRQYRERISFEAFTRDGDASAKLMLRGDLEEGYVVRSDTAA